MERQLHTKDRGFSLLLNQELGRTCSPYSIVYAALQLLLQLLLYFHAHSLSSLEAATAPRDNEAVILFPACLYPSFHGRSLARTSKRVQCPGVRQGDHCLFSFNQHQVQI